MNIRPEQMQQAREQAEEDFIRRLMLYMRKTHSAAGPPVTDETLRRMMVNGIKRARSHRIETEAGIAGFINLMFTIAANFDEHPAFKRALEDPSIPEKDRLRYLPTRVTQQDHIEAAQNGNMLAWFAD